MKHFQHDKAIVGKEAQVGEGSRVWAFSNVQNGAVIGKNCNICDCCFIEKGAVLGDNVTLKNGISVYDGITLEDDVFCGPNVSFTNDKYPRSNRKDQWELVRTIVKKGATIGSNSTILCGVTIGEYASIGAGAVVTKDILPHQIVVGNPAKHRGYACRCGRKLPEDLKCSCGLTYKKTQEGISINE